MAGLGANAREKFQAGVALRHPLLGFEPNKLDRTAENAIASGATTASAAMAAADAKRTTASKAPSAIVRAKDFTAGFDGAGIDCPELAEDRAS